MDSSVSSMHGEQEMSVWNGHYEWLRANFREASSGQGGTKTPSLPFKINLAAGLLIVGFHALQRARPLDWLTSFVRPLGLQVE